MSEIHFNGWFIDSADFDFRVLSDGDEVIVCADSPTKDILFSGAIAQNSVTLYEISSFLLYLEINQLEKSIFLRKIEHEDGYI